MSDPLVKPDAPEDVALAACRARRRALRDPYDQRWSELWLAAAGAVSGLVLWAWWSW